MTSRLVVAVEPERMNERLAAQQGLFLFPFDLGASFEENLAETFRLDPTCLKSSGFADRATLPMSTLANICILKIVLPKAYHVAAIEDLRKMNISTATLFPGLDGFARSLQYHLGGGTV